MEILWNKEQESGFFKKTLSIAKPEQIFYKVKDDEYYAYYPKTYKGTKSTLQSRNSLIGCFTEKWTSELFERISESIHGYAVHGVVCEEIGLSKQSSADVAICKTKNINQNARDIKLIIEVKMSIAWNWRFYKKENKLECMGDYNSHIGNPSLLRSDSMLKAIGKSINIRLYDYASSNIPIIIIGNTPITNSYIKKVDHLKRNGIVQGFWSINPTPTDKCDDILKKSPFEGFYKFDDYNELQEKTRELLNDDREFFSAMRRHNDLGKLIELANKEITYEEKAKTFLSLLRKDEKKCRQIIRN